MLINEVTQVKSRVRNARISHYGGQEYTVDLELSGKRTDKLGPFERSEAEDVLDSIVNNRHPEFKYIG